MRREGANSLISTGGGTFPPVAEGAQYADYRSYDDHGANPVPGSRQPFPPNR